MNTVVRRPRNACAFNVSVELSLDEAREFVSALRAVIVNGAQT